MKEFFKEIIDEIKTALEKEDAETTLFNNVCFDAGVMAPVLPPIEETK